ncbi:MAG: WbuC family cupin fold metalloprotein [Bacteroidales bacterium]
MPLKKVDAGLIADLSEKAAQAPRRRHNLNFHTQNRDVFQRMLNALEPGSYVQPHKHENPDKDEVFVILKGRLTVISFGNNGEIEDFIILDAKGGQLAVEVPARTWHMIAALEPATVVFEFKHGPYDPTTDKIFASWAPPENHPDAEDYLTKILKKILESSSTD